MLIKHWFVRITCFLIFIGLGLGSFNPAFIAQEIPRSQATDTLEVLSTETPTDKPLSTETSTLSETPTDNPTEPLPANETPTPENRIHLTHADFQRERNELLMAGAFDQYLWAERWLDRISVF